MVTLFPESYVTYLVTPSSDCVSATRARGIERRYKKGPRTTYEAHYVRQATLERVIQETWDQGPTEHNLGDFYVKLKDTLKKHLKGELLAFVCEERNRQVVHGLLDSIQEVKKVRANLRTYPIGRKVFG